MIKRVSAFLLAATMLLSVTACNKKASSSNSSDEWEYEYETIVNKKDKGNTDSENADSSNSGKGSGSGKKSEPGNKHIGGDLVLEDAGNDPLANYKAKGTVIVSVDTARLNDYQALFDAFKKTFPNIKLKFDYFAHTTTDSAEEYLSTRAAAGNMPDIVYDDAGPLPTYLTQGWMYPLDEFVKGDTDYQKYVPDNLKKDYTYGGKLYALPHQAHYETFLLNTDLWNRLNIKDGSGKALSQPALNWTLEDFEKYCKLAVTDKSAAQEDMGALYSSFVNCFNKNDTAMGYNTSTKKFETNGIGDSIKFLMSLKAVPGLEAASLRSTSGSSGSNNYFTKFGSGNYSDNFVAFHKGMTLFHGLGTWEYASKRKTVTNFKWKMIPFPQKVSGSMPYHVDACWMTKSVRNKEAAWQLLRYVTYSYEGNEARLSMYDAKNKGKYSLVNELYYPTSHHPKVEAKFKSLPGITDAQLYLYENQSKCYRFDMAKLVPDWNNIYKTYLTPALNSAKAGTQSGVDQALAEPYAKANKALDEAWAKLNKALK